MKRMMEVKQSKEVPGREKPIWLKHGVAFVDGDRVSIKLESLPLPNKDGEVWLNLFEPIVRDGVSSAPSVGASGQLAGNGDLDDAIPF
jgi:hypothetical protein